jgi:hypothetical protein
MAYLAWSSMLLISRVVWWEEMAPEFKKKEQNPQNAESCLFALQFG